MGDVDGAALGRAWLVALPAEVDPQRRLLTWLLDSCEGAPLSMGRVQALEEAVAALPGAGELVDVLRTGS